MKNDKAYINHYVGQAYFSRAYAYFELALHYCKNYDPASAGSDYGIPLVTEYAPSSDYSKYPGRSSLKETFRFYRKRSGTGFQLSRNSRRSPVCIYLLRCS